MSDTGFISPQYGFISFELGIINPVYEIIAFE
jgi:hypothetical protein